MGRERQRERDLICIDFVLAGCSWLYSRYLVKGTGRRLGVC